MKPTTSFLLIVFLLLSCLTLSAKPSSAVIKSLPTGTKILKGNEWEELNLKDIKKTNLSEKDSLWIITDRLSIKSLSNKKTYWAYPGKWSVKQILENKAAQGIEEKPVNYSTGHSVRSTSVIQELSVDIVDDNGNDNMKLGKNNPFFVIVGNPEDKPYYASVWWVEMSGSSRNCINLFSSKESQLIAPNQLSVLANPVEGFSVYPKNDASYPREAWLYFIYDEKPFDVPLTATNVQELRVSHRAVTIRLSIEE